jgi:hypothetical protein
MVPAGNRPSSNEPDGVDVVRGIASVGSSDADPRASPQTPQKWLRSGFSEEHERHRAIEAHSITGEMPVVALERRLDEGLG